jgi:hypothetical protein
LAETGLAALGRKRRIADVGAWVADPLRSVAAKVRYDLIMDDPLDAIINLLRDEQGVSTPKLRPSARLYHDLGITADDACELLQRLHERFGTDFSELDWREYFGPEGIPLSSTIIFLVSLILACALTVCLFIAFKLPKWMFWGANIALLFIILLGANRLFPGMPKRPITIAMLAEVIQNGAWPKDPAKVR